MIRILIIVLRGENVGKDLTKSPSQLPERAISVIRLGFAKVRCFTAKSYTLPTLLVLVNALIYSVVNVFVAVWLGVKMPDFA